MNPAPSHSIPPSEPAATPTRLRAHRLGLALRRLVFLAGAFFLSWTALCLTRVPMLAYGWLATAPDTPVLENPDVIVVLGGGGIPSESGLIRCYEGAAAAREYPRAGVIVSLPADGDPDTSSVGRMREELVLRGVARGRIRMETRARNTREQAEAIRDMLRDQPGAGVLLVSSEYHLRRSILAFRKAGLRAAGRPSQAIGPEADMGANLTLRYRFWHNLSNSVTLAREGIALLVYRLRGWI